MCMGLSRGLPSGGSKPPITHPYEAGQPTKKPSPGWAELKLQPLLFCWTSHNNSRCRIFSFCSSIKTSNLSEKEGYSLKDQETVKFQSLKGHVPSTLQAPWICLSHTIHRCTLSHYCSHPVILGMSWTAKSHMKEVSITVQRTMQLQQNAINPKNSQIQHRRPGNTPTVTSQYGTVGLTLMNILTLIYGRMKEPQPWHSQFTSHWQEFRPESPDQHLVPFLSGLSVSLPTKYQAGGSPLETTSFTPAPPHFQAKIWTLSLCESMTHWTAMNLQV